MKNILPLVVLMIAVLGCDISKYVNSGKPDNSNTAKPTPSSDSKPSSPQPEATPSKPGVTSILKKSAGKYPYEIKLLDNAELKDRLKKLLGAEFAAMKANWNVETPMEIESGIFKASACEAHNCGSNNYILFVDLKNDNINVFHVEDSGTKHYFESGEIKLPEKFTVDF